MSKNHKPYDERETKQADATAYALGELSHSQAAQSSRSDVAGTNTSSDSALELEQTRRLGQLLRAEISGHVASADLNSDESTRCSSQVREAVLEALDAQETSLPFKPVKLSLPRKRSKLTRVWEWGLVAGIAAIIGVFFLPKTQEVREASRRHGSSQNQFVELSSIKTAEDTDGYVRESMALSQAPGNEALVQGNSTTGAPRRPQPQDAGPAQKLASGQSLGYPATADGARQAQSLTKSTHEYHSLDQFGTGEAVQPEDPAATAIPPSNKLAGARNSNSVIAGVNRAVLSRHDSWIPYSRKELAGDADSLTNLERTERENEFAAPNILGDLSDALRDASNEQYKPLPENPFWRPIGERAMSTFSIDVDTASYANVRRFLTNGALPPPEAVRLEEFINYFHYDYPQPEEGMPFAVDLKLFGCPWNTQHALLRVGLHGQKIETDKRPISNIVYLVDVSGSMADDDKLPLLKRGLQMMVDHLGENDTVSIVTYAGDAGIRLAPTNGANKKKILDAIDSLQSGGSTNGSAGIELAYKLAQDHFVTDGVNRVILATDGDLNVGVTSDDALVALINQKAATGVFLTVLGFGTGNLKDAKLEGLADNGNGLYGYIDSLGEAHKVLVEQMSGNLVTIAKDVKIQIEFNPAQVAGYRLIGYENRVMANEHFADDRKDAGEIGAGHTVTALYEIVPVGTKLDTIDPSSPTLKYQTLEPSTQESANQSNPDLRLTDAAASGELARVALRFKTPQGTESRLVEFTTSAEVTSFSQANADCRFAAAVAAFGMKLRQSAYAGNITLDAIAEIAAAAIGDDSSGYRAEFVDLVRRAREVESRESRD